METAVIGGGVTGLFTALYLKRAGARVVIFEQSRLGAGSVHAAGILEGAKCQTINNWPYLRTALRHLRTGSSSLRELDGRWFRGYVRNFGKPLTPENEATICAMGSFSSNEYRALAETVNDFDLSFGGLTEVYDSPASFRAARDELGKGPDARNVAVTESGGGVGSIHHPEMGWLDTDLLVARLARELEGTEVVYGEVGRLSTAGEVSCRAQTRQFDAVVLAAGVACRRLGIPLTAVKGFGWRIQTEERPASAVIYRDSGLALVPLSHGSKLTGGFDYSFSASTARAGAVLDPIRQHVRLTQVGPAQTGYRPTTPDGLPIVGRRDRLVVATGGFMLGWTLGPGIAQAAADLALGRRGEDPFLARFLSGVRDGDLTGGFNPAASGGSG